VALAFASKREFSSLPVDGEHASRALVRQGVAILKTEAPTRPRRDRANGSSLSGTNLERAGDYNQRVVLQAIRVNGPITRAELSKITGLTAPAVSNIAQRLQNDRLIMGVGRVTGARGQPATKFMVDPDGCLSIGVNIDRDHITVLALDLLGKIRARWTKTIDFALPDAVAKACRSQIQKIVNRPEFRDTQILGLGVALPDDLGSVPLPHQPDGYSAWSAVNVSQMFSEFLPGRPVFVENDAAAAALGELQFGQGVNRSSFFYMLVNFGLGGGLVIDGHYVRGANGRSGEIGFLPNRSAATDAVTLQDFVSVSALLKHLDDTGYAFGGADDLEKPELNVRALIDAWVEVAADLLAEPLINLSCLIDPEAVLIGGRLPSWIIDDLANALNHRLRQAHTLPALPPVLRAATAADAPAVGAAILPFIDKLLPSRATLMKTGES
jgi:predicted NBD/HSP70 family sugar kinase